jgi:hypothetical protein
MPFRRNNEDGSLPTGVRFLKLSRRGRLSIMSMLDPISGPLSRFSVRRRSRKISSTTSWKRPKATWAATSSTSSTSPTARQSNSPRASAARGQQPTPSDTRCAWCGYFVRPHMIAIDDSRVSDVHVYYIYDELRKLVSSGGGLRCHTCSLLQCAVCNGLASADWRPENLRCRTCGNDMSMHAEKGIPGPIQLGLRHRPSSRAGARLAVDPELVATASSAVSGDALSVNCLSTTYIRAAAASGGLERAGDRIVRSVVRLVAGRAADGPRRAGSGTPSR